MYLQNFSNLIPDKINSNKQKSVEEVLKEMADKQSVEMTAVRKNGDRFPVELSLSSWNTMEGNFFSGIIRDISERKKIEEERESLIKELQDALSHIKTLSGLVPICSSCKKIRDDKGFWNQIESYIEDHSQAAFTHGICPDCKIKLYGDFLNINKTGDKK